jgi:hypothetical protein
MAAVPWDEIGVEVGTPHAVVLTCLTGIVVRWVEQFLRKPNTITMADSA